MTASLDEAFKPRSNSIGFLRWFLAFAVIFSHAGPLGGFYGGKDLGTQLSSEQSLGGVAVAGFFFISGFLITRSRQGRSTIFRFFWRRVLRIFPAFWTVLLLTAFFFAPVAWWREKGSFAGYFSVTFESPLTYFTNNMFLALHQRSIAGLGANIPLGQEGGLDWNGSAWTLIYEFKGYLLIGILGLFGFLANRYLGIAVAACILVLNFMLWTGTGNIAALTPFLGNIFNIMFMAPFAFGILFALLGDKIRIDDRVAVACAGAAIAAYCTGGWNTWGQFAFCYFIMWCAVRLPIRNWEKFGDLSYGIYIFAWPLMQLAAYFGLQSRGWLVYHVVIIAAVHIAAFLSWHYVEAPAMSLKNWTPAPVAAAQRRLRPLTLRLKTLIVNPTYSSTRFAQQLRAEPPAEPAEPLVSELPSDRVDVPVEPVEPEPSVHASTPEPGANTSSVPDTRTTAEPQEGHLPVRGTTTRQPAAGLVAAPVSSGAVSADYR